MDIASRAFKNADSYDSARKGYTLDAAKLFLSKLEHLEISKVIEKTNNNSKTILELGAGTGQFTKVLVEATKNMNFKLIASEPLESMGTVFKRNVPSLELICCRGDKIPLPDSSIDAVVGANALHYLANVESFTEIARVLIPGGILAFVCNYVDLQRAPWTKVMYDLSAKYYNQVGINLSFDENGITDFWEKIVNSTGKFDKVYKDFTVHSDAITEEETVKMFMSYGAFQHCNEKEKGEIRNICEKLLKDNFSGAGKDMTEIPMKCNVYWMRKSTS